MLNADTGENEYWVQGVAGVAGAPGYFTEAELLFALFEGHRARGIGHPVPQDPHGGMAPVVPPWRAHRERHVPESLEGEEPAAESQQAGEEEEEGDWGEAPETSERSSHKKPRTGD